ncbi:MAG: class I adenylate-forming enzyme family protein [Reyranellaceae bacterium]
MPKSDVRSLRDREIARRAAAARDIAATLAALAPDTTYAGFLRQGAAGIMDRRAVFDGETALSYAELFARVEAAAALLQRRGIAPGQAVALLVDNSARYAIWFLAVLRLGAIAVPVNNKLVQREIAFILDNSAARLMVFDQPYQALAAQVTAGRDIGRLLAHLPSPGPATQAAPLAGALDSAAAVYYTSGTTGVPKGVVHTHRTLIAGCLQAPLAWGWSFDAPVAMAVTPMFHIASHTLFFPILHLGGTLVIATFRADEVLRLLDSEGVTSFFGVPSILLIMAARARELRLTFPAVKVVQFGAAPMPMDKLGEVQALFPNAALVHGMGQTESCGTLVTLPGELALLKIGSVGIAIPATEVAIFDDADREVPPNRVGELVGRSPSVMREYLGNPQASAETLKGGWLHTGDLGYRDEDGFVFLVDRKKDMIIRGGENVYSNEVEQVLAGHPALSEVAVVGGPDPVMGEKVCAFVAVKPGIAVPDVEDIRRHCLAQLAPYKVPADIRFLDALPRNATGKILKPDLRQILRQD